MKIRKKYDSKWVGVGVTKELRAKMYSTMRIRAYTILKNYHEGEYKKILRLLINHEYEYYKNLNKQFFNKEYVK